MKHQTRTVKLAVAGIAALSLFAAACGSDDSTGSTATPAKTVGETSAPTAAPAETPAAGGSAAPAGSAAAPSGDLAAGDVFVTGSSTVEPISQKVGELAKEKSGGTLNVTVEGPGTGDGFKKFCAGEGDINDASRKIKDEEAKTCAAAGIEYVELEIGLDGITVATSKKNTAVTCLDTAALYALVGPESEGFAKWSDANKLATELGSKYASLPDAALTISGPGEESGTYDTFLEFAIKKIAEERGKDDVARADYSSSPNDNTIVEGIEGADTSLGWVGFAYYEAEQDRMNAIQIAGKDGNCVAPSAETIADGSYPFSRTLYIYVNKAKMKENPAVASFVDLYVNEGINTLAKDAGYITLGADRAQASAAAWAAAKA